MSCRCRSSRGENLENVGLTPPAMETNGGSRRSRDTRDQWGKYPEPQQQQQHQQPPQHHNGSSHQVILIFLIY